MLNLFYGLLLFQNKEPSTASSSSHTNTPRLLIIGTRDTIANAKVLLNRHLAEANVIDTYKFYKTTSFAYLFNFFFSSLDLIGIIMAKIRWILFIFFSFEIYIVLFFSFRNRLRQMSRNIYHRKSQKTQTILLLTTMNLIAKYVFRRNHLELESY